MPETGLDAFTGVLDGPMYVVTVAAGEERSGCLVGFASQCSIRPPRFVVWLSTANHTYRVARGASYLTVHALRRDQHGLAELFGGETGDRVDKLARVSWRPSRDGSPVLTDVRTWFVGEIEGRIEGGDHVGFLLAPVEEGPPGDDGTDGSAVGLLRYSDAEGIPPGHPV
ncbi:MULTISPECIES: flavin reductase family protein [unclassified Streptomyces]|uniref:flavin reductase family protein n=1 Tax=unclassified Streptomyces TaxID=2593676 RepID=UPI0028878A95|nr:flavin reductase family protein [Streptomyces sp. DSM 41633]